MFQVDRQLPNLCSVCADSVKHPAGDFFCAAPALDGTLVSSCCPGLRTLLGPFVQYIAGQLTPLRRLRKLLFLVLQQPEGGKVSAGVLAEVFP
jgi:hypothetical protein